MTTDRVGVFRPCVVIPCYNNPKTIEAVVGVARSYVEHVVVVDDGSDEPAKSVLQRLCDQGKAQVVRLEDNRGKGGAVKAGLRRAENLGYSHAVQVDADGQHDLTCIPAFVEASRAKPEALVLGTPVFDDTVNRGRLWARKITNFWVAVEAGRGVVGDAMVGFRVYPIRAALDLRVCANRMDFDIEIAVRWAWQRGPIVHLPVAVRYLAPEEGGVSHFQLLRDNLRISWLHTRLTILALARVLLRWLAPE